jgi:CO/xanthine dehydrogenase FAD-binding subunit
VAEALAFMALEPGRLPILAGGTDLVIQCRSGELSPQGFIDINELEELSGIETTPTHVVVGARATHAQIASHPEVREHLPSLAEACSQVGGRQVQNVGTIGGNVMNASPAGNTLPVLLAHEAEFIARDLKGDRTIHADDLYTAYRKTALKPDELLVSIRIPLPDEEEVSRFYRIASRRAQAVSKISVCFRGRISHGGIKSIRIALGSVAPTVIRAQGTEMLLSGKVISSALIDKARRSLADEIAPIDDVRSTADYRKYAAVGLMMRFLREAASSSKGE